MERAINSQSYLNQLAIGYMVNTLLSKPTQAKIQAIQDKLIANNPNGIWAVPADALHITLLDWLAPLVDYGDDKDSLFRNINPQYDATLTAILQANSPVPVTFNKLIVSQSAIVIVADHESTRIFNTIRQSFLEQIDLLPDTKQPPNIVHSTIIRFVDEIPLENIKKVADALTFSFTEQIAGFQLVRETILPMLEYSIIKKYPLGAAHE